MTKFVFTDELTLISNNLWLYTSVAGACLSFIVLIFIAVLRIHPRSRPHLDRVSFRLMTIALVSLLFYGIANAVGGSWTGPTWGCGLSIWILQFSLEYASFLIFCIALNLQLVVCHRVHVLKLEKWYIYGSLVLALAITIPPYAAGQYGWDTLVKDCWYSNPNPTELMAWQIGTQLFWQMFTTMGELITAYAVIHYMWKHRLPNRVYSRPKSVGTHSMTSQRKVAVYANAYRGVIARIGLYPFASAVLNVTSVSCVIRATVHNGVHDWTGYRTLLLSDFVYGGRPVVYAILAATDPAFLKAVRALFGRSDTTTSTHSRSFSGTGGASHSRGEIPNGVHVELTRTQFVDPGTYPPDKHTKKDAEHGSYSSDEHIIDGRPVDFLDIRSRSQSVETLPQKDGESLAFGGVHYADPVRGREDVDTDHEARHNLEAIRERRVREEADRTAGHEMFQKSL